MQQPNATPAPAPLEPQQLIDHAARIYAAELRRCGACFVRDVIEHGFNADFVRDHWAAIRHAGEDLARARPRA